MRSTGRQGARALLALLAVLVCTRAAPAAAQDVAAAEALFSRGVADLKAGRYTQACAAIAESQRMDPQAGTLFTLAQCETRLGRIATALARYRDYLALYDALTPDQKAAHKKREGIARAQLAELGPQVSELTLTLSQKAPPGTIVKKDGLVVSEATLGVPLPIDPGEHVVSAQAPGGPWTETRIAVKKREKKALVVEAKPAPAPPQEVRPGPPAGTSGQRVGAYVVGSLGAAALVLGGVMGGLTLAKKATIDENCGVGGVKTNCKNRVGADAGNSAQTTALVSTIGIAAGAAGLVTALVLGLTEPRAARPPVVRGGASVRAGVLAVGDTGAVLGFRGAW